MHNCIRMLYAQVRRADKRIEGSPDVWASTLLMDGLPDVWSHGFRPSIALQSDPVKPNRAGSDQIRPFFIFLREREALHLFAAYCPFLKVISAFAVSHKSQHSPACRVVATRRRILRWFQAVSFTHLSLRCLLPAHQRQSGSYLTFFLDLNPNAL